MRVLHTDSAPAAIGPYSQAVLCDGWLYCSGQIALDPRSGSIAGDTAREQAQHVLKNLASVLEAGGAGMDRVVKTTIYLADMGDFAAVNAVYAEFFGDAPPARACVEVSALPKGVNVEVDAVATVS